MYSQANKPGKAAGKPVVREWDVMSSDKKEKIHTISIDPDTTIMESLKTMDALAVRLLLVMKGTSFKGVLSIGDIQRAIIKNVTLDTPIYNILRKEISVAYLGEDFEKTKKDMLLNKTECMPVLDQEHNLVDVLFWDELFSEKRRRPQSLKLPIIVMAGGKGSRLAPLTNILPKALIPIGKKPIIEHIMDRFVSSGCAKFHISVNYKSEMIKHYFQTLGRKDLNISYFEEEKPLGTAGSLFLLKDKIHQTFFMVNCDIIIDEDYGNILDYHKKNKNQITIVAALKHYRIPYGIIKTRENGLLTELEEKPELMFKINSGMYILEPELLKEIPENQFFHITDLIEKVRKKNGRIGVFPISEKSWRDIGEWDEYLSNKDLDFS